MAIHDAGMFTVKEINRLKILQDVIERNSNEITERQRINFTEAALIRYFSPEYNKIYKDTFPSPAHTTYSECYDLDLNSVSVELQTDRLYTRVWSKVIKPDYVHFCTFPLHSKEDRMYMFEIARLGGE